MKQKTSFGSLATLPLIKGLGPVLCAPAFQQVCLYRQVFKNQLLTWSTSISILVIPYKIYFRHYFRKFIFIIILYLFLIKKYYCYDGSR